MREEGGGWRRLESFSGLVVELSLFSAKLGLSSG
jgi:hypothetical protein